MNIILLSGGSGKRLWPLSNDIRSKQFIKIFKKEDGSDESMIQRVYRQIKTVDKNATVTICHSRTKNLAEITKRADILVAAIGKAEFVKADMVKEGVVVIDVGINRTEEGKLKGDVDFENVSKKASYITPVPGGVGPMTIAMLMNNVVKAAKMQNKK